MNEQREIMRQPYAFIDPPDTPPLNEKIVPGDDRPNLYGPVVCAKEEIRVREKDGLVSVWIGAKLEATVKI